MSRTAPGRIVGAIAALTLMSVSSAARAQTIEGDLGPADRVAIEGLIDAWYAEHCAAEEGRPYLLLAPGAIDASPGYRHRDTGAASLGPRYYVSLAATTPLFRYDVTRIRADARFASVQVREHGYTYASAADQTYERQGRASLVVERQDDGRWLVLAHRSDPAGFPPSLATVPLPDLKPRAPGDDRPMPEPRCGRFRADEHAG